MKKIIAVSAGKLLSKKEDTPVTRKLLYLNYGLLGLVTMIHEHGFDIEMFQAYGSCDELFDDMEKAGIRLSGCECVLLSIPSNYSVSWCREFCERVKKAADIPIIAGGRWVVDGRADWIKEKLGYVDVILEGFGEKKIAEMFDFPDKENIPDGSLKCFDRLDYTLLHDYQRIQPVIEVSRGCGSGCGFCADRANKRVRNKPVPQIFREFEALDRLYGDDYKVYFEAPHFVFEKEWTKEFRARALERERIVPWRCTSRVETVPVSDDMLSMLAESGLRIIDIGLESASPRQLTAMNKTASPGRYLEKADMILRKCHEHGIMIKLNILLFAGETSETVRETTDWLCGRRELIKGVSCANLICYKNSGDLKSYTALGASIPDPEKYEENGFIGMDLSGEISCKKALELCAEIPGMIMTPGDYYDIKEHSYFERGYSYEDFLRDSQKQ